MRVNARTEAGLGIDATDLAFMRTVRMKDFYANAADIEVAAARGYGEPLETPGGGDCRRCLHIARRVVDAALARMR